MPVASSDTLVIESTPAAKNHTVAMTFSNQFVNTAAPAMARPNVIVAVFGTPPKHPSFSPVVFEAHDTMLDWVTLSKKLERFRDLKKGWDSYNAIPPDTKPLGFASEFLDVLRRNRYLPARLAPSVVGGVGMSFREEDRKVYVEFSNKGTVHVLFSDGVTEPNVQKMVPDPSGYRAIIAMTRAYLNE